MIFFAIYWRGWSWVALFLIEAYKTRSTIAVYCQIYILYPSHELYMYYRSYVGFIGVTVKKKHNAVDNIFDNFRTWWNVNLGMFYTLHGTLTFTANYLFGLDLWGESTGHRHCIPMHRSWLTQVGFSCDKLRGSGATQIRVRYTVVEHHIDETCVLVKKIYPSIGWLVSYVKCIILTFNPIYGEYNHILGHFGMRSCT